MFNPMQTRVGINGTVVDYVQSISFGFSVHDKIVEAKFICCKDPFELDEEGKPIEIESIGTVDFFQTDSYGHLSINLQISEGAPHADYFKEKYYGEV